MKIQLFQIMLLFLFPAVSFSQEVIASGEALYNSTYSQVNGAIMGAAIKSAKGTDASKSGSKKTIRKTSASKLNFIRSEELSQSIQKNFISTIAKEQSSSKTKLEKVFEGNKLRSEFDRLLESYNYSAQNLADVMTAYLVISWQVVNMRDYNDKKGFDAVRRMLHKNLLSSDYLQTATDLDKQTVSETIGYQAMLTMKIYQTLAAGNKKDELEQFKNTVHSNLKESGLDLKNVELTSKGFLTK